MKSISIREPTSHDQTHFLTAMQSSQSLHAPWVKAPLTAEEFEHYLQTATEDNQKSFLACDELGNIVGVFNISQIIRGVFQSAYLGFYAVAEYAGKGYMSAGLQQVLAKVFGELDLHRLEANIQPENHRSIQLVKKNGFRYEGYSPRYLNINDEWCGHERWAITREDYQLRMPEVCKQDCIDIVPYNSDWPNLAAKEINKLRCVLPMQQVMDIQHVGSTAIPGLAAKPIIDIQIAVHKLDAVAATIIPILQKLNYEYWQDNPDSARMFFAKGMPPYDKRRTHHIHVCEHTSHHWRDKLAFRDYLRAHPALAKEYEQLKFELAEKYKYDREKYTDEKAEFVAKILVFSQLSR